MSLTAEIISEGETKREIVPIGLHEAILIWLVDLGQQQTPWGWKPQILFTFELCKLLIEVEGQGFKPRVISSRAMTPFITQGSNLGQLLQGWFGKLPETDFDLKKLVGKHCMINVVHNENNGKTYANIGSIAPPTEECRKIGQHHEPIIFELGRDQLDPNLPEWIRVKVMNSKEWNEQGQQNEGTGRTPDDPDDIPF